MAFFPKPQSKSKSHRSSNQAGSSKPRPVGARTPSARTSSDPAEDLVEAAADIRLHPVDEVRATTRPTVLGQTYVEAEFKHLAREQRELFRAEGHTTAREPGQTSQSLASFVAERQQAVVRQRRQAEETATRYRHALEALRPFSTRSLQAKNWYLLVRFLLLVGDAAGVAAGAIMNGEIPALALAQAIATGLGAVVAGAMIGTDVKTSRIAHQLRHSGLDLTEPALAFLAADDDQAGPVKAMRRIALTVAVLIGLSVFALRTSVDGFLGGLIYLGLAIGVTLASAANSYTYTDPVDDHLHTLDRDYAKAESALNDLTLDKDLLAAGEAEQAVRSIRREHRYRGRAAAHRVHATLNGVLRNNPSVAGHGHTARESDVPLPQHGKLQR